MSHRSSKVTVGLRNKKVAPKLQVTPDGISEASLKSRDKKPVQKLANLLLSKALDKSLKSQLFYEAQDKDPL